MKILTPFHEICVGDILELGSADKIVVWKFKPTIFELRELENSCQGYIVKTERFLVLDKYSYFAHPLAPCVPSADKNNWILVLKIGSDCLGWIFASVDRLFWHTFPKMNEI